MPEQRVQKGPAPERIGVEMIAVEKGAYKYVRRFVLGDVGRIPPPS